MSVRHTILTASLAFALVATGMLIGSYVTGRAVARQVADNGARVAALRDEMARDILEIRRSTARRPTGTHGQADGVPPVVPADASSQLLVDEVKRQLQSEMGLMPVRLLRERRESFVELNGVDNFGKSSYGTAGYLGGGYFITVKHGVVSLDPTDNGREPRRITLVTLRLHGKDVPAQIVDTGDADAEVQPGDWAVVRVKGRVDLPALQVNTGFAYDFAEPIVRLGNDYSKGIILSTGYVGQKTANGMVTCLTDGHPGVSGGGVLDQEGDLVGIPVGRMQGDFRFSFILPVRDEMFRKVPHLVRTAIVETTNE